MAHLQAIEFFSGIGAFAEAASEFEIEIVRVFDQDAAANQVYQANFGLQPVARNLDTITADEIPAADIWWMSPPCKPFSVRGLRKDDTDPRARSFLNLIARIPECLPHFILIENVGGFPGSRVHEKLLDQLNAPGYRILQIDLCSTGFGVPMRRPRCFILASRFPLPEPESPEARDMTPLSSFLDAQAGANLRVEDAVVLRYGSSFDIVEPENPESRVICFTSGYFRCRKSSGSMLRLPDGGMRRVSPEEILRLLGFNDRYQFPATLDLKTRWRLAGNSVDVRCVRYLLDKVLRAPRKSILR